MKVILTILFVAHLAAGFSNCPKRRNTFLDVDKYNDYNFDILSLLPRSLIHVSRNEVTFRLWTRDQKMVFTPLFYGHLRDEQSIRPDKPFKFIIHGWSDCADSEWYEDLKKEFLKKGDYNVIQVDWRKPAGAIYPLSAGYTKDVGKYLGEFIIDLHQTLGVPYENIHLIGHSLGAHISGFAGKTVESQARKTIGRITAMDPAGPLFLLATRKNRLSQGDALYVDVIHTDGGKFGYANVLGHADFYPNNGVASQPGCGLTSSIDIVEVASCSHIRSYQYFKESINSNKYLGHECSSYEKYEKGECQDRPSAIMGENVKIGVKGVFYLSTNN